MNAAELTDSLAEAWDALLHTPLFGIALTLAVAVLSRRLWLAARQTWQAGGKDNCGYPTER